MPAYPFADERGQVMVEYMVITVVVFIVIAGSMVALGRAIGGIFKVASFMWSLPFP